MEGIRRQRCIQLDCVDGSSYDKSMTRDDNERGVLMKPFMNSSVKSINLKSTGDCGGGGGGCRSAGSGRRKWERSRKGDMLYSRRCPIDASLVGK